MKGSKALTPSGRRESTDAELIRYSEADPEQFTAIFDRHFDTVYGYVYRRFGSEMAEEIAAEVLTRAFELRARYDSSYSDARPWLLGIASNLMRGHWRSERRRLKAYARLGVENTADTSSDPVDREGVFEALKGLRADDREALLLRAWADLSYEQIGVALDIPLGTVRSRIARARKRLQPLLAETAKADVRPHTGSNPREGCSNA
jgi:RNA polymerase sigma-70 factor (ECF subfamily)